MTDRDAEQAAVAQPGQPGAMASSSKVKRVETRAVVIRADGTREDLGVVAFYHRNLFIRLGWHVYRLLRRYYDPLPPQG